VVQGSTRGVTKLYCHLLSSDFFRL
jgi:hypothetical protein